MTLLELLQQDASAFIAAHPDTAPLLKRVFLFLEDGEFTQADSYCEKVLDAEPENVLAYIGKLMASRRIQSLQDLAKAQYPVDDDSAFRKALRFAPEDMKAHLQALNMQIYGSCIAACRSRARVHLSHSELKETAQQYHTAVQLWEAAKDSLPDAAALYDDMADEIADFNWKLMLHNRQCPDNAQLIARGIPVNNDRWYCSAAKWAGDAKREAFAATAQKVLFSAHRKCMDAVTSGQSKLAAVWADHYKTAAAEDDPLCAIHDALLPTDGYTCFAPGAAEALLKLIAHYESAYPEGVAPVKTTLQSYYEHLFQTGLCFAGEAPAPQEVKPAYEDSIASKEQLACGVQIPDSAPISPAPAAAAAMTPEFAMAAAGSLTEQLVQANAAGVFPSLLSIYLVGAKALTVRYGRKRALVCTPGLFEFACGYYEKAIASAQPEQAEALRDKFNEFLLEAVRLEGATAQTVQKASECMGGSNIPYQIYLSRLSGDYTVEKELLIPASLTQELGRWQTLLEISNPRKHCYLLTSQSEKIERCFADVEAAVTACREYPQTLQGRLHGDYEDVLFRAGDGREELSTGWEQKMQQLQKDCSAWAGELEDSLNEAKRVYAQTLLTSKKRIKHNAAVQLTGIIFAGIALLAAIAAFAAALIPATGLGWLTAQAPASADRYPLLWFSLITIGVPALGFIFSLVQCLTLPRLCAPRALRSLWLRIPAAMVVYITAGVFAVMVVRDPNLADILAQIRDYAIAGGILLASALARTLLDAYFSRLPARTHSRGAGVAAKVCFVADRIAYLAQAIACLFITGLFVYAAIVR